MKLIDKLMAWVNRHRFLRFWVEVFSKAGRDRASAYASQVAFYILMSAFPFAILVMQLIRIAPVSQESMLFAIDSIFPEYLLTALHAILQEIYSTHFGLVPLTIVTMLWTTSKVMHALTAGLDTICAKRDMRSWVVVRTWSLLYTGLFAIVLIMAAASTAIWQPLRYFLMMYRPHGVGLSAYATFIRTVYTIFVGMLILAAVYKIVPRRKLRYAAQLPGAVLAISAIYVFSIGVSIYVSHFNGFSTYGSLTTLTLIMFWLYFSCWFIMLGAVVNEVLRRDRAARTNARDAGHVSPEGAGHVSMEGVGHVSTEGAGQAPLADPTDASLPSAEAVLPADSSAASSPSPESLDASSGS